MSLRRRTARTVLLGGLALSALGPLAVLVVVSLGDRWFFPALWPPRLSAESWRSLLGGRLGYAAATSVGLATSTGALACFVALPLGRSLARLTGWRRTLGATAAFLPVAAPPIALGTGLQVSFLSLGLGGTLAGVIVAHLVPAVAYTSLYFLGLFLVFDPRIEEEARSLGAGPIDLWRRVLIPLLRRPLAEGFALGFLVSWAQVPLTLLVGGGAVRTLPLEVLAFVRAGQERYAATGALLLIVPVFLALGLGLSAQRAEPAPL